MGKKNQKSIVPFSINEVLFVSRIAKMCGMKTISIASYGGATFSAVKIVKGDMSKFNLKLIKDTFQKEYNKKLFYEISECGMEKVVYLTIIKE